LAAGTCPPVHPSAQGRLSRPPADGIVPHSLNRRTPPTGLGGPAVSPVVPFSPLGLAFVSVLAPLAGLAAQRPHPTRIPPPVVVPDQQPATATPGGAAAP